MNNINIFKKPQINDELLGQYIVTKKLGKLKTLNAVKNYGMRNYLFDKLSHIYLNGYPIYYGMFDDSHDGISAWTHSTQCLSFSVTAILAMKSDDILVNGNLAPECKAGYNHYWVEFDYFDKKYVLDGVLAVKVKNYFVLDTELMKVYDKDHYYSTFKPTINFIKSNKELMQDDFVRMHRELLKSPEWSYDKFLFYYYNGEQIEECKKRLYENIEVDENGHVVSYNTPDIEKSQSK